MNLRRTKKQIAVSLDEKLHKAFKTICKEDEISVSERFDMLMVEYLFKRIGRHRRIPYVPQVHADCSPLKYTKRCVQKTCHALEHYAFKSLNKQKQSRTLADRSSLLD